LRTLCLREMKMIPVDNTVPQRLVRRLLAFERIGPTFLIRVSV
jgi:hypothetical protein